MKAQQIMASGIYERPNDNWEFIESKVDMTPGNGPDGNCWLWKGRLSKEGYANVTYKGKLKGSHVHFYEYYIGPVPEGLELDHWCRNRHCVRPGHLEAVTHQENMLRGNTIVAKFAMTTHCPQGHEYTPENTYVNPKGSRLCITCRQEKQSTTEYKEYCQKYYQENRERFRSRTSEYSKRYRERNREKLNALARAYRAKKKQQSSEK